MKEILSSAVFFTSHIKNSTLVSTNRGNRQWGRTVRQFVILEMGGLDMSAADIDVSNGKSMVLLLRSFGDGVAKPFEVPPYRQ